MPTISKLLFIILFLVTTNAASYTGNGLLKACSNFNISSPAVDHGICLGYLIAVADMSSNFCPPESSTQGQAVLIVARYLDEHPEELHLEAYLLVRKALEKAFPCR